MSSSCVCVYDRVCEFLPFSVKRERRRSKESGSKRKGGHEAKLHGRVVKKKKKSSGPEERRKTRQKGKGTCSPSLDRCWCRCASSSHQQRQQQSPSSLVTRFSSLSLSHLLSLIWPICVCVAEKEEKERREKSLSHTDTLASCIPSLTHSVRLVGIEIDSRSCNFDCFTPGISFSLQDVGHVHPLLFLLLSCLSSWSVSCCNVFFSFLLFPCLR